jgi:arginase
VAAVSNFYAAQKQRTGLIWIDSHPDLNTPDTSYSQNIYGMSVAVLLGRLPGLLASIQTRKPAIDLRNFCYIGLRDVDPPEREAIKSLNISAFTMKDIDLHGLPRIMERAIAIASEGTAGFVASFDLDVCDPPIVPGVGFPVRGGFTYREAELVWELLYDSKKLRSIELVELNPTLDRNQVTAELGISLLESAVGKAIL